MLKKFGGYRSALYLTSAIALIELAIFLQLASLSFETASRVGIRVAAAFCVVFGVWVQSRFLRYLGAVWLVISAVMVFWPLFVTNRAVISVTLVLLLFVAVLSLAASFILLFSTNFSDEFTHERLAQPKYKTALRHIAFVVLIAVIVVATLNDIYRIALRYTS